MAVIDDLYIRILADGSQLEGGLNKAKDKVENFSHWIGQLGDQLKGAFSVVAIEEFIRKSMDLAEESARAMAKVSQAIKSTNGVAGQSLEDLKMAADDFKHSTLFDDDQVLNEVSAQLLTFTNIAGDNFMRAQEAALNLATVLGDGEGLKGISIQLGKALNDPVQGLAALRKSGISFSESQIEVIKNLSETNRLTEAQSLILNELERQYGGQAKAAAEASNGLKQLQHSIEDVMKSLGNGINNSTYFQSWLKELGSKLDSWSDDRVSKWNAMLITFGGGAAKFMDAQREWEKALHESNKWMKDIEGQGESTSPDENKPKPKKETTYSDLKNQLKELQKEYDNTTAKTREQSNAAIEAVKKQIKDWQDAGKKVDNYAGSIKGLGIEISALEEKKSLVKSDPMAIAVLNDLIAKKREEKKMLEEVSVAWVEYGNKVNTTVNGHVVPSVVAMNSVYTKMATTIPVALAGIYNANDALWEKLTYKNKDLSAQISQSLNSVIASVATSLGTLIGDFASGAKSSGDVLLSALGKIIGQVGQMAIGIGTAMLAINLTLHNPGNPLLAIGVIAAGVAAVAIGQMFANSSKSIASGGDAGGSYSSGGSSSGYTYDTRSAQGTMPQTIYLKLQGRDFIAGIEANQRYYNRQG